MPKLTVWRWPFYRGNVLVEYASNRALTHMIQLAKVGRITSPIRVELGYKVVDVETEKGDE